MRLEELSLNWKHLCSNTMYPLEMEVMEGLQPHSNLRNLKIVGSWCSTFPSWFPTIVNLRFLELEGCSKWETLAPLEQFPFLESLSLKDMSALRELVFGAFGGDTMKCFRCLRKIFICEMSELEKWIGGLDTWAIFPCLEKLEIVDCPKLREFPRLKYMMQDGDKYWLPFLTDLTIMNCPLLALLPPLPHTHALSRIEIEVVSSSYERLSLSHRGLSLCGSAELTNLGEVLMFGHLRSLKRLILDGCTCLSTLPWEGFRLLDTLEELRIISCPVLLSPSIEHRGIEPRLPPSLKKLVIRATGITGKHLSQLLQYASSLLDLTICECPNITWLKIGILTESDQALMVPTDNMFADQGLLHMLPLFLPSLEKLCINDCTNLVSLSADGFRELLSLQDLTISNCLMLMSSLVLENQLEESCVLPPSLQSLKVTSVLEDLQTRLLSSLTPLNFLCISQSPNLTSLMLYYCTALQELTIKGCNSLAQLEGLRFLRQLNKLQVYQCPGFAVSLDFALQEEELLGQEFQLSLKELIIDDAEVFSMRICRHLASLKRLVFGTTALEFHPVPVVEFTEDQEKALELLSQLEDLELNFCLNLRTMPSRLNWLSLRKLRIYHCPNIKVLPERSRVAHLQSLSLDGCSLELKEECKSLEHVKYLKFY
ncbi:hypothetical protein LUZ60_011426 [Juncus effusus]|nr:hypothetical protein LUZ60_011426 [Juncus effusus]